MCVCVFRLFTMRERLGVRLKYFTYYLYKFFSVEERFRFSDPLGFYLLR